MASIQKPLQSANMVLSTSSTPHTALAISVTVVKKSGTLRVSI